MERGLRNLEGSQWVERVALRGGERSLAAAILEKAPLSASAIRKGIPRAIERIDVSITGDVGVEKNVVTFTARGSGTKIRLDNRPARDENDEPEDLLGEIVKESKAGRKTFEIGGVLEAEGKAQVIYLTNVRPPAAK